MGVGLIQPNSATAFSMGRDKERDVKASLSTKVSEVEAKYCDDDEIPFFYQKERQKIPRNGDEGRKRSREGSG